MPDNPEEDGAATALTMGELEQLSRVLVDAMMTVLKERGIRIGLTLLTLTPEHRLIAGNMPPDLMVKVMTQATAIISADDFTLTAQQRREPARVQ